VIEVGTVIAGKLRVERLLGRGGMAWWSWRPPAARVTID
jgi:hypothetical protein